MNEDEPIDISTVADSGPIPEEEDYQEYIDEEKEKEVEIIDYHQEQIKKQIRVTVPYLTKYERARLIGTRAEQLNKGSLPTVEVGNLRSTLDIARKELEERKIPLIIRRKLPNNRFEDWKIEELIF